LNRCMTSGTALFRATSRLSDRSGHRIGFREIDRMAFRDLGDRKRWRDLPWISVRDKIAAISAIQLSTLNGIAFVAPTDISPRLRTIASPISFFSPATRHC
jgi:hypothetical protein